MRRKSVASVAASVYIQQKRRRSSDSFPQPYNNTMLGSSGEKPVERARRHQAIISFVYTYNITILAGITLQLQ